jgi:serine/threonine protein kinase
MNNREAIVPALPRWLASLLDSGSAEKATAKVDLREVVLGDRYRLENLIGKGASSIVYRANDLVLGQDVAIKVLRRDGILAGELARTLAVSLRDETRLAMKLSHPNVLRVFHYEQDGGWEYVVMEFVVGENLNQVVHRRTRPILSVREVASTGRLVLSALHHAHGLGVIHNDLKPGNLMVSRPGGIKVCDFGLARLNTSSVSGRSSESRLTTVAGTPAFMSPERIRGEPGDQRSDLYGLAATLYTLANGHTPFGDGEEAIHGHLERPFPSRSMLPQPLHDVLARAMAKSPDDRYSSAAEMVAAWTAAAAGQDLSPRKGRHPLLEAKDAFDPDAQPTDPGPSSSLSRVAVPPLKHTSQARPVVEPVSRRIDTRSFEPRRARAAPDLVNIGATQLVHEHGTVSVGAFRLERTPVTNAEFARYVAETGARPPDHWCGKSPPRGRDQHPVCGVDLEQARGYARWRGRRLPTQAEWEVGYRGKDKRRFPWGNDWRPEACLGVHSGQGETEPVGQRPAGASSWGCLDMLGNVWEWTEPDPRIPPPEPGKAWVYGGSFRHRCDGQAPPRTAVDAQNAYDYLGFRCAEDLP